MDFAKEGDTHMIEEFQTEECEMKRPEIHSELTVGRLVSIFTIFSFSCDEFFPRVPTLLCR